MNVALELNDQAIEAIARRVVELNGAHETATDTGYLDVSGAASFLACQPPRIYALVSAKRLPVHRDGSRLLFDRNELRAYVAAGGAKRP